MKDDTDLPLDLITKVSADPLEEHQVINEIQDWVLNKKNGEGFLPLAQLAYEMKAPYRIRLVRALRSCGSKRAIKTLYDLSTDTNKRVRFYLSVCCEGSDHEYSRDLLSTLCRDEITSVSAHAIQYLIEYNSQDAINLKKELFQKENQTELQVLFLQGFVQNPDPEYERLLLKFYKKSNELKLKFYSAVALKTINSSLLDQLSDDNSYLNSIKNFVTTVSREGFQK